MDLKQNNKQMNYYNNKQIRLDDEEETPKELPENPME